MRLLPPAPEPVDLSEVLPGRSALVRASTGYRRAVIFVAIFGVIALAASAVTGKIEYGALFDIGIGLGWMNSAMLISATAKFAASPDQNRNKFMGKALRRLLIISLIAAVFVFAYHPEGPAVLFGMAFFQLTVIGSNATIMYRGAKQQ